MCVIYLLMSRYLKINIHQSFQISNRLSLLYNQFINRTSWNFNTRIKLLVFSRVCGRNLVLWWVNPTKDFMKEFRHGSGKICCLTRCRICYFYTHPQGKHVLEKDKYLMNRSMPILNGFENIVGKRNGPFWAHDEQMLHFWQCFQRLFVTEVSKGILME